MQKTFFILIVIALIGCRKLSETTSNNVLEEIKILSTDYIAEYTTYFELKEDSIIGSGKETLKDILQESQFVVFGERHNSRETSKMMSRLIPLLKDQSFNTLCLEIGPHSARKLKELIRPPENTVDNLRILNSKYIKEFDDYPIPFVNGVEDAKFLQVASEYEMDIWGIDQEYYNSAILLMDQLLHETKDAQDYQKVKALKVEAVKALLHWYVKDNEEDIEIFDEMQNDPAIANYIKAVENLTPRASEIVKDLKFSWDVYTNYRNDSHADRVSYLLNNFLSNYEALSKTVKQPKIFLKFGGMHTSQIISNGAYDLGYLLEEIATENNTACANIISMQRFYEKDGKEIDYHKDSRRSFQRYKLFAAQAKRNSWAIIDLQKIREDLESNRIKLPQNGDYHDLKSAIDGYDYMFFIPLDAYATSNLDPAVLK